MEDNIVTRFSIKEDAVLEGAQLNSRRVDSTMRAVLLLIVSLVVVAMARKVDDASLGKFFFVFFYCLRILWYVHKFHINYTFHVFSGSSYLTGIYSPVINYIVFYVPFTFSGSGYQGTTTGNLEIT